MARHIVPALRYRDGHAAIDWLCAAFGFERHLVVPDGDGGVAHAQLMLGEVMIMLGSSHGGEYSQLVSSPLTTDGVNTQSPYLVVADPDALHARATAAGAEIVIPLRDEEYGGRGFTCRDPEGHLWTFGSYDPFPPA